MNATLSGLVAAGSMFLGQTGQVQVIGPSQTSGGTYTNGTVTQQFTVTPPQEMPQQRRPFLSRIRSWFGHDDGPDASGTTTDNRVHLPYVSTPTPQSSDYIRMPAVTQSSVPAGQPVAITNGASASAMPITVKKTRIRPAFATKVGRDEKFAWITGQLEVENGSYVLYYATPDTVDQYEGRLVLQPQVDMKQFRPGDLITVEGQVQSRGAVRSGSASYRVVSAGLVEHPTP